MNGAMKVTSFSGSRQESDTMQGLLCMMNRRIGENNRYHLRNQRNRMNQNVKDTKESLIWKKEEAKMNGTKGQEKQRIRHVLYYQTQANTRKRNHRGMNDNPKKQMGIKERRKRKPDTRETCEGNICHSHSVTYFLFFVRFFLVLCSRIIDHFNDDCLSVYTWFVSWSPDTNFTSCNWKGIECHCQSHPSSWLSSGWVVVWFHSLHHVDERVG